MATQDKKPTLNETDQLDTSLSHELLTQQLLTYQQVHVSVPRSLVVTNEDRLELWLAALLRKARRRYDWVAPLGIALSITLALVTAEFREFLLPAAAWQALFVVLDLGALTWLLIALRQVGGSVDLRAEIRILKEFDS